MGAITSSYQKNIQPPSCTVFFFDDESVPSAPTHRVYIPLHAPANQLVLGTGRYGPMYYLAGQPVHDGSVLALESEFGTTIGMFVWSGKIYQNAKLVFFSAAPKIVLQENAILSWAEK